MPQEFNLIDKKWLPCLMNNGERKLLSLHGIFAEAHEIAELLDASPLVTISLHRLLLAILHRALMGPVNMKAWKDLWEARQFEMAKLDSYLEKNRDQFFLFDDEKQRPFFQFPKQQLEIHPVQKLVQELASGNNPAWFDHNLKSVPAPLSTEEVARYLVATQAFAFGGGQSEGAFNFADAPLTRDLIVLVRGDTLFETLMLNLVEYSRSKPFRLSSRQTLEEDKPVWEQESIPKSREIKTTANKKESGTEPRGYVDYLTWQSRQIHLIRDPDGSRCQLRHNMKLKLLEMSDPFKCYRIGKGTVQIDPQKAVWRDCHTLFQKAEHGTETIKRPEVFNHLAQVEDLRSEGAITAKTEYRFDVFGLSAVPGQASVHFWRHERLPLPVVYLNSLSLWPKLADAIELTEQVWITLRENVRLLAVFTLIPNWHLLRTDWPVLIHKWDEQKKEENKLNRHRDISNLAKSFRHGFRYWSQLGTLFPCLLKELAEDYDPATEAYGKHKLPEWAAKVRAAARDTFRQVAVGIEGSDRGLKAVSLVEQNFEARLNTEIKKFKNDMQ